MIKTIGSIVVGIGLFIGSLFGHSSATPTQTQNLTTYGSYSPSGGGTYRIGQSIGTSDTTIRLSSFKEPVSGIFYTMTYLGSDIEYGTLSPQSSVSEFMSFSGITQNSDGSATLTGVIRGLSRTPGTGGCVASTTLAQPHSGQSIFILSNPPCQLAEYAPLRNAATVSGAWTYSTLPTFSNAPVNSTDGANKVYVDGVAIQGAATSTYSGQGIVQLATAAQASAGVASSSQGRPLVLPSAIATSSCTAVQNQILVASSTTGKLAGNCLDTTSNAYTWTKSQTFSSTSISASAANPLTLNSIPYTFPSAQNASSSALETDANGKLTWLTPQYSVLGSITNIVSGTSTVIIPAGTFTSGVKKVSISWNFVAPSNPGCVAIGSGSATTTIACNGGGNQQSGTAVVMYYGASSGAVGASFVTGVSTATGFNSTISFNSANNIYVAIDPSGGTVYGMIVTLMQP